MIKQKLISKRKEKGFSQADMAYKLHLGQAQYCRRENGKTQISKSEWNKMARVLETTLDNIYEPEDGVYVINNENASGDYSGSQNHFQQMPNHVLETMRKYIELLEKENKELKERLGNK